MNCCLKVWLPPDGDSRLTVLQSQLALEWHLSWADSFPIYAPYERPLGTSPITLSSWFRGEAGGLFGQLVQDGAPWTHLEMGLSVPDNVKLGELDFPRFSWRKGRSALLEIEEMKGGGHVWRLSRITGWKASAPNVRSS